MATISAVMVARNEEENIANSLAALQWCDEIIVMDNGSTDATSDIAREYADSVYYDGNDYKTGDPARKKAVEKATGDWILLVDADEIIPKELSDKIRKKVDNGEVDVFFIPIRNYIFGRWIQGAGWWPTRRPRFFRSGFMEVGADVHNAMTEDHIKEEARVIRFPYEPKLAIYHFSYKDIADFMDRLNRYTTAHAEKRGPEEFSYIRLFGKPVKELLQRYVLQEGYKLGMRGVMLSFLMALYHFLIYLKLWEMKHWGSEEEYERRYDDIRTTLLDEYEN